MLLKKLTAVALCAVAKPKLTADCYKIKAFFPFPAFMSNIYNL